MNDLILNQYPELRSNGELTRFLNEDLLDTLADYIEQQGRFFDLEFTIYGGSIYRKERCIKFSCSIPSNLRTNAKSILFVKAIKATFNLEKVGFDVSDNCFWLWGFKT